jgi:hypothetical protein
MVAVAVVAEVAPLVAVQRAVVQVEQAAAVLAQAITEHQLSLQQVEVQTLVAVVEEELARVEPMEIMAVQVDLESSLLDMYLLPLMHLSR